MASTLTHEETKKEIKKVVLGKEITTDSRRVNEWVSAVCAVLVFIGGIFAFVVGNEKPDKLFWDENYYLSFVEKYLHGTFFMHAHPPLAIMFLALGEKLLNPNKDIDKKWIHDNDFVDRVPPGYSFKGVRFFPGLFAAGVGVLIFLIIYRVTKHHFTSVGFAAIYLMDTAGICHHRAAMLDSTLIFFILLAVWKFIDMVLKPKTTHADYIILGFSVGLAMATKFTAWFLLILPVLIYLKQRWRFIRWHIRMAFQLVLIPLLTINRAEKEKNKGTRQMYWEMFFIRGARDAVVFIVPLLISFLGVWTIHIKLTPNPVGNLYSASDYYKEKILAGQGGSIFVLPVAILDNIKYGYKLHTDIAPLSYDNPNEMGSHPLFWPLGIRSISYRWDSQGDEVRYKRLVANPFTWSVGLIGLIMSMTMLLGRIFYGIVPKDRLIANAICMMMWIWLAYMLPLYGLERVMYLYHYFPPLIFTYIMAGLVFYYIFYRCFPRMTSFIPNVILSLALVFGFWVMKQYLPLAIHDPPLRAHQVERLAIFKPWRLQPAPVGQAAPQPPPAAQAPAPTETTVQEAPQPPPNPAPSK
ncbi:MAG: phospholipid carrier-dependent glycosyltransferase [Verrucomicrobiae bacterium]|nr:phospholipid carrier-dependent glycosyltransferase [Verrucomicrobiae bacterium]